MTRWHGGFAVWLSLLTAANAADHVTNPATENIKANDLLGHIQVLASDEYEGRAPGTPGEDRTVAYLTEQFRKFGLKPGNPDGTFVQEVPLVGFQASAVSGAFRVGAQSIDLKYPEDWVAVSRRLAQEVKIENSDVVFVGYGVVAPEYGWDDYKDVDVRGKTILMLVNDPAVPDPKDPTQLDPALFKGKAMTYYGRWTYKYEIASEKGAAAVLLVHETGPAGYPYSVVVGSWGRENFDIRQAVEDTGRVAVEAWIGLEPAKQLFTASGQDFDALKKGALSKDFRPVSLNAKARFSVTSTMRDVKSRNVVARLEGSDPERKKEHIIYTAHWDHLGRDDSLTGDKIFNGAADNASGVAAVLEIAKAYSELKTPPKRSILFLALTAEEKGLLGAKYYAEHPLYPLADTLADLNMDVINLWGRTRDITSVGLGQSTLDDLLREVAQVQGRVVIPDAEPEKGLFYRSDHFEFAKQGVPALNVKAGVSYVGKPDDYGRVKREEYTQNDYHKVSDQVKPDWDLTGAVDDLKLLWEVGYRLAEGDRFPEWSAGSEFRERREAMLKKYRP
ncbi:M20/M25/M40 family metallo-hydrolase [Singulisphaera sp. Ch08]|uniref:M20/M25/M40 family metallo-hydrolase n=2 Tax=Singulisphaera sp. Ch08 TaxID=3120278 RepID=A0AAU7CES1_9BACT